MNEILIHVTTWMTLKHVKYAHHKRPNITMYPICRGAYSIQIHRATKWNRGCQGMGKERNGESVLHGDRGSVKGDDKALEMDGDGCTAQEWTQCH